MTTRGQMSESAEHEGGHTELMRAALEGETETVKRSLESGADVNERDAEGRTALMFAVTIFALGIRECVDRSRR
jgi:ankyrin repeat protein